MFVGVLLVKEKRAVASFIYLDFREMGEEVGYGAGV